ncbi:MAG: WG repeat-containing protein [Muribaculaceae bacterium]|nr:WG repeat-containing protein [Muribaculaceae bacterium]
MKKSQILSISLIAAAAIPFVACNKGEGYEKNISLLAVQTSKEKWGFVDADGKLVFEDEFKEAPTSVYNGVFSVEKGDGVYAVYKVKGDKYSELGDLSKVKSVGYMEEGLIPATVAKSRIALYDEKGDKKFEIEPVNGKEVEECAAGYSDGLLSIKLEDGKSGYIDKNGELAIKAAYDIVTNFSNGVALVGTSKDEKMYYSVINKKGETVFKLKDGQTPQVQERPYMDPEKLPTNGEYAKGYQGIISGSAFSYGYLIVSTEDHAILYDNKGETIKFPKKINSILSTNGNYVTFLNEDEECGVADMEGEIVIRPKYERVFFDGGNYVGIKDDSCVLLDKEGETIEKLDYQIVVPFGSFGYIARENEMFCLLDKDGKQKGKNDFYQINPGIFNMYIVRSDYFDYESIANVVLDLISDNGVGDYTFGSHPEKVFAGESPSNYTYDDEAALPNLEISGAKYRISGTGGFTERIADWELNTYNYDTRHFWNNNASLFGFSLEVNVDNQWGKTGQSALVSAFKKAGYTVEVQNDKGNELGALLKKGKVGVLVTSKVDEDSFSLIILDTTIRNGADLFNILKESVPTMDSSFAEEAVAIEEVEPDAWDYYGDADTVAEVEEVW